MKTFEVRITERKVVVYHVPAESAADAEERFEQGEYVKVDEWGIDSEGPFIEEVHKRD